MEVKTTKKRARSSNWEEEEKRLLRQLIMERIHIVEKKDCTTNTNAQKKAAWQEILFSFNSLNKKKRDMTQIITQWRNTKGQVKSRESEYRKSKQMTGGGPPPPSPPQEDLELIQSLPNEFVVDSNDFDSDSIYMKKILQSQPSTSEEVQAEAVVALISTSESEVKESIQLPNPPENVEEIPVRSTPLASAKDTDKTKNNIVKRILYKPKSKRKQNTPKTADNYEEKLFLLAKQAKENKEQREEELHKKRMMILDLEQKYWEKKLENEK